QRRPTAVDRGMEARRSRHRRTRAHRRSRSLARTTPWPRRPRGGRAANPASPGAHLPLAPTGVASPAVVSRLPTVTPRPTTLELTPGLRLRAGRADAGVTYDKGPHDQRLGDARPPDLPAAAGDVHTIIDPTTAGCPSE